MAAHIQVDDEVKAELERLQDLVHSEKGVRLSHSDLLRRLLRFAKRNQATFMEEDLDWEPPSRAALSRFLDALPDHGFEVDARKIDETLYGGF